MDAGQPGKRLEEGEARRRFAETRVARLATVDERGHPHLVPFVFAVEQDRIYSAVDQKPKRSTDLKRLANVRTHPEVAALVDRYDEDWTLLWWVRADGRARIIEEGSDLERALRLLRAKYPQYEDRPPIGPVVMIEVERWRSWAAH